MRLRSMGREREPLRLGYRPALDGMRGIAVLLVLLSHAAIVTAGVIGVNIFFVLSGFLITSLILVERRETGRLDLVSFYRRRAVRLLPALFMLSLGLTVYLLLDRQPERILPDVGGALSYVGNWLQAAGIKMVLTSHTWSLAVEEQFYLVWPVLLVVVMRSPRPALVVAALLVCLVVWRFSIQDLTGAVGPRLTRGTDMVAPALLLGALLSFVYHDRPAWTTGRLGWIVGVALIAVAVVLLATRTNTVWWFELSAVGSALLISSVYVASSKILAFPPLVYIGRISYGVYLYHFPIFAVLEAPVIVEFGVVLLASALSYELVEAPLLRRYGRRRAVPQGKDAVVAGPVAPLPKPDLVIAARPPDVSA